MLCQVGMVVPDRRRCRGAGPASDEMPRTVAPLGDPQAARSGARRAFQPRPSAVRGSLLDGLSRVGPLPRPTRECNAIFVQRSGSPPHRAGGFEDVFRLSHQGAKIRLKSCPVPADPAAAEAQRAGLARLSRRGSCSSPLCAGLVTCALKRSVGHDILDQRRRRAMIVPLWYDVSASRARLCPAGARMRMSAKAPISTARAQIR